MDNPCRPIHLFSNEHSLSAEDPKFKIAPMPEQIEIIAIVKITLQCSNNGTLGAPGLICSGMGATNFIFNKAPTDFSR